MNEQAQKPEEIAEVHSMDEPLAAIHEIALALSFYGQHDAGIRLATVHEKIQNWIIAQDAALQAEREAHVAEKKDRSKIIRALGSHRWTGCQRGGDPTDAGSSEWVRYCDVCGMEDSCEDPLPPCPGANTKDEEHAAEIARLTEERDWLREQIATLTGTGHGGTPSMLALVQEKP